MWAQPDPDAWRFALSISGPLFAIVIIAVAWFRQSVRTGAMGNWPLFAGLLVAEALFLGATWYALRRHRTLVVFDDHGVWSRGLWHVGLRFVPWSRLRPFRSAGPGAASLVGQAVVQVSPDGSCLREFRRRLLVRDHTSGAGGGAAPSPDGAADTADLADRLEARFLMRFCPGCGRHWPESTPMTPCDRCGMAVDDVTRVFTVMPPGAATVGFTAIALAACGIVALPFVLVSPPPPVGFQIGVVVAWGIALALTARWAMLWRRRPFLSTTREALHFGRLRQGGGRRLGWAEFRRLHESGQLPDAVVEGYLRMGKAHAGDLAATIDRRVAAAESLLTDRDGS